MYSQFMMHGQKNINLGENGIYPKHLFLGITWHKNYRAKVCNDGEGPAC